MVHRRQGYISDRAISELQSAMMRFLVAFRPHLLCFRGSYGIIALIVLLPGQVQGDESPPDSTHALFRKSVTIATNEHQTAYQLPDQFLVYHTERIETGVRTLERDADYQIDYERGMITLSPPLTTGLTLVIHYERYPVALQQSYFHRRLVIERTLLDSLPNPRDSGPLAFRSRTFDAFSSDLTARGSKTFSVTAGTNRDASLSQSLRIQISGRAADDVEVVALLSDRSSPIQPEGNTRQLQELDNVLIQVKTPHVETTMGDYTMTMSQTVFARYERKLKGALGEIRLPNGSFQVAAATSEGEYTSFSIQGIEGNQGPYQLTGQDGAGTILVIAGTEKVWIDGERLIRGEDNDYTIDYAGAQITFTRHRLITGESRIVVDFEASDQQYRRNLYAGRGEFSLSDRFSFGTTFVREGDDGATPVSSTGRILPPSSQALIGFDIKTLPMEGFTISSEVAFSGRNLNTLSDGTGSRQQNGSAFRVQTEMAPKSLTFMGTSLGHLEIRGGIRRVQSAFQPVGRMDDVEYTRRYDQGPIRSWQGNVAELDAIHRFGDAISIQSGFGRMSRPDGFASNRRDLSLNARPSGLPMFSYRFEEINSTTPGGPSIPQVGGTAVARLNGRWIRHRGSLTHTVWHLRPIIAFEQERRRQLADGVLDGGRNFTDLSAGLEIARFKRLTFSTEISFRTADAVGSSSGGKKGWLHESTATTSRNRIAFQEWRSLTASAQVIRRSRTFRETVGESNRESLIDSRVRFTPWREAFTADARYEINNTASSLLSRQYLLVGRGQGNLHLDEDSGEYIPDPDGEYIVRYDPLGAYTPVTGVKASMRFTLQPYRKLSKETDALTTILRSFSSDTYLAVDEKSKSQDRKSLYLLNLRVFQQDSSTVLGNLTFRQDVFLFPQHRDLSIRLRYQRVSTMNNQLITGGEHRFREEQSLRIRVPVRQRTTAEVELTHGSSHRTDVGRALFRIISDNGSVRLAHRPRQPLELLLQMNAARDTDRLNHIRAVVMGLAPRVTYSFSGRGRTFFQVDWASVRSSPSQAFLPFEMAGGRRPGNSARWQGSVDYRLGQYVSMLLQYDGRRDPGRPVIHTGRMEMRAFF